MDRKKVMHSPILMAALNSTTIPNGLIECDNLSMQAKIVWIELYKYACRSNAIFPGIAGVAKNLNCTEKTVKRLITELRKIGLVKIEKHSSAWNITYTLYEPVELGLVNEEISIDFYPQDYDTMGRSSKNSICRNSKEYREWRTEVYERDDYTCQKCGKRGGALIAHHIDGYANNEELRTELSNGITLCKKHHTDLHHLYGYDVGKVNLAKFMEERSENA